MSEELFTCETCGRSNFTKAGLVHHRCSPVVRSTLSVSSVSSVVPLSPSTAPVLPTEVVDGWSEFERWLGIWRKTARADVALQIMLGFLLNALHKDYEIRAGQPRKEFRHCGGISEQLSWPERLAKFNVSETTARRWRMMADAIKPRIRKLGGREKLRALLELHPRDWTDADSTLIENAVLKVTDGYTQTTFLQELGAAKLPTGSGGARPRPEHPVTTSEQIEVLKRSAVQAANQLVTTAGNIGDSYLHLENPLLELIDATLAQQRAAIKYLLNTAPNARDLDQFHRLLAGKA